MRSIMSRFKANSLLMLAAVIWGVGNVFHKTILAHLDPIAVVFLTSASTVITPIAAWLIMRERPSALILFVAILTVVGSALLAGGFNGSATAGDAFAILTAICFAVWTVELGRHVQAHGHPFATA